MNELQRIETFVPRSALLYAPEPKLCILPELKAESLVEKTDFSPSLKGAKAASALVGRVVEELREPSKSAVVEEGAVVEGPAQPSASTSRGAEVLAKGAVGGEERTDKEKPAVEAPVGLAPEALEKPTFSLAIWRCSSPLLIIDSHQRGGALPTERLLTNMLRHSRWGASQLKPCEFVHWPLLGIDDASNTWAGAREMLASFLDGIFLHQSIEHVWLLGEDAFRVAGAQIEASAEAQGENDYQAHCYKTVALKDNEATALVLPSLAQVLHEPLLKAKIWPSIR